MSVYKPKASPYYHFDFQLEGRRFHGSTGVGTLRAAQEVERKKRQAAALGQLEPGADLTLNQAAGLWWAEVGQHKRSARILEIRVATLVRLLGPNTRLRDIDFARVQRAIEKRRGETYARGFDVPGVDGGPSRKAARYELAAATVNSDIVKRLRPILNRAATAWGARNLPAIDWKRLALPEAETPIVHFADAYQLKWLEACGPTERFALVLLLAYGFRFGELFFRPSAYLPDTPKGPALAVGKRKNGQPLLRILRPSDARQIAARVGLAQAAGLESIWLERDAKGDLVTVSYAALQSRLRKAAERAGVDHDRLIHSIRHHVGTDFLNATGDLAKTQALLGHADIKSTLVYAHALDAGLRDAINSRNSPEVDTPEGEISLPKQPRARR